MFSASINTLSKLRAKWTIALLVLSGGGMLQSGCVHQPFLPDDMNLTNGNGATDTTGNQGGGCDPNTVYFQNEILPLLKSSCAKSGCHDLETAKDNVILTEYDYIINTGDIDTTKPDPNKSKLIEAITETDIKEKMPPIGNVQLTSYQISRIKLWIQQGAKNNHCDEECDTTNVTYSGTIQPLLALKCVNCHSGSTPQGAITLVTYDNVLAKVKDGSLPGSVNALNGFTSMPYKSSKLPQCELDQIRIWIDNGALNN